MTAWDVNHRTPRIFSKWSYKELVKNEIDHNMTLGQMVTASAATPDFFLPFTESGNFYISGDNIAASPAMFAFMNAVEKNGIQPC